MLKDVLNKIKPSPEEEKEVKKKVKGVVNLLNKNLKGAKAVVGGSFEKGTWLAGDYDIDIFVVFEKDGKISDNLERVLKKTFKRYERVHGSRDYFQLQSENITFELIPVLKIRKAEEAKNVTDVSLLHVKWVKEHVTPELADQIRLAKQFFRAQRVYGAETFIKGFSGYVTEILIIYYGSFLEFLKHALHWAPGKVIDPAAHAVELEKHQPAPLIVIDPVQPTRNAAAAVSEDKLMRLVKSCRSFVQRPFEKSFEVHPTKLEELKGKDLILIAEPLKGKRDVVGTKLLKLFEHFVKRAEEEGFAFKESGWDWNGKALFWFSVKEKKLSKKYKHFGPPVEKEKNVALFKKKHRSPLKKEKGRVYVMKDRKYTSFSKFVDAVMKEKELKSRAKKIVQA